MRMLTGKVISVVTSWEPLFGCMFDLRLMP